MSAPIFLSEAHSLFRISRQKPIERIMKAHEIRAFHRRIVTRPRERDYAFFSSVGLDNQALEPRRNDFIFFCE